LDIGKSLPNPDSLLINGQQNGAVFSGLAGNHFHQQKACYFISYLMAMK